MKKRKIIIRIVAIIFVFLTYCFISDYYNFDKKELDNNKKNVRISFVEIDYDKTKNLDFNSKNSEYMNYLYNSFSTFEKLTKDGKYYVATIKNINKLGFKNIKKITTVLNDVSGSIVDDVKYDKTTNKIYIPEK